jgi:hypothetical protein
MDWYAKKPVFAATTAWLRCRLAALMPAKYDIYLAKVNLGGADYVRPSLVLDVSPLGAKVVPISSQVEKFNRSKGDFVVHSVDPDFPATGLDHDANITGAFEQTIPIEMVYQRKGSLTGDMLSEYKQMSGH